MITYAQNFEDVMLARAFRNQALGFYIDVGAMDPIEGSVTKHFYDRGWHGINVEPDQRSYIRIQEQRPRDINLCVALGDREEARTFYQFEAQGISTFHPKFRRYFEAKGQKSAERNVEVMTLQRVCLEHVTSDIDFLKIDAEGWEGPIIRGADWVTVRPRVVLIEATEPFSHIPRWNEWEPDLLKAAYCFVYYDGLNRFYIRSEEPGLREAFAYPPNVLDEFIPFSTAAAQERAQALEAELDRSSDELREARLWVGRLAQEQAADRLYIERLNKENHETHQLVERLMHQKEEERRRAELFLYEREVERQRSNQLWHEKQAEHLHAQHLRKGDL